MTQETYNKAVELYERQQELKQVKECIAKRGEHKLSYLHRKNSGDFEPESEYTLRYIRNLLDKHDLAIREEIDNELNLIKKQIEAL